MVNLICELDGHPVPRHLVKHSVGVSKRVFWDETCI